MEACEKHLGASIWSWFGSSPFPVQTVSRSSPCQRTAASARRTVSSWPGTLPAPCGQCHSGKFCSTAKISPSDCLREKGQHHCLHFTEGETERGHRSSIKIQSRSTRLSDSQTLFMGTHHPPHTARVFSAENQDLTLQRLRDIFLRSSMFVISMNWERLRVF